MRVEIKICGVKDEDSTRAAAQAGADYVGFVHYAASPRHTSDWQHMAKLASLLPSRVSSVAVMVDPSDEMIREVAARVHPAFLQLHGKETPERIAAIRRLAPGIRIIRSIAVRSGDDIAKAAAFYGSADLLLFDAKPPELPGMLPGGNGLSFDWALLANREFPMPWMLSGGLNIDNVGDAIRQSGARAVDVSSSVESSPGVKDPALIDAFITAVRS
jgi:phosphoribosylanthranilate isomerase